MFSKILIANRGEIAIRIIRACKEMGIYSVAVFSEADKNSLHVSLADEAYCIGKAQVKDSYLNMHAIISAALASKAEAIHPGYGFLSENYEFASLCEKYNIAFIGPDAKTMTNMSDKEKAIQIMKEAGLPIIPSSKVVVNVEQAVLEAEKIGYPLLIKARSGGGGKGIRLARNVEELKYGFHVATSEAASAFGDDGVYLEKFLSSVKHIEMQIIADNHTNAVCLGERDCSTQRKNQKMIEESPCAALPEDIRKKMIESSIRAVNATGYKGVGTLEFLYDGNEYYFMEMNTRLQVEHPVTEMVTGIDLVKWQIRVASGMKLGFTQEDISPSGHAIECRINAEDAYTGFRPSCGKIETLHIPGGPWVRFDTAIYQGYVIQPFYDSMIGKLIVHAKTRDEAIRKMKAALCELIVEGIDHNARYNEEILDTDEFVSGKYTTDYLSALEMI